jgi:integrase
MRINEALSITWEQVDSDNGYVTVGESKTEAGAGRSIPVDKGLLDGIGLISYLDWDNQDLKVAHCDKTFYVPYFRRR